MVPTKKELILAAAVLLLIPLLGEVALRVFNIQFDGQFYKPDRDLGWVLVPVRTGS